MTRRLVAAGWLNKQPGEPGMCTYENSRRGGQVRDVQPPPGAAVLAGAESRRDSGPLTLPTPMDRSRAPYSGWAPGGRADEPPPQPLPPPPPPLPQPPDPPWPQPTATDGDGSIGGRGHCRRMALLLLPLLPFLFLAGLLLARPKADGHHLGNRHKTAPPEGSWHYDRPAEADPEPPGRHPRGIRSNLPKEDS